MALTTTTDLDPLADPDDRFDSDVEALRGRRCLDGLWLALVERLGTDALDLLLLDAQRYSEAFCASMAGFTTRHALARDYADRLFRGGL